MGLVGDVRRRERQLTFLRPQRCQLHRESGFPADRMPRVDKERPVSARSLSVPLRQLADSLDELVIGLVRRKGTHDQEGRGPQQHGAKRRKLLQLL